MGIFFSIKAIGGLPEHLAGADDDGQLSRFSALLQLHHNVCPQIFSVHGAQTQQNNGRLFVCSRRTEDSMLFGRSLHIARMNEFVPADRLIVQIAGIQAQMKFAAVWRDKQKCYNVVLDGKSMTPNKSLYKRSFASTIGYANTTLLYRSLFGQSSSSTTERSTPVLKTLS